MGNLIEFVSMFFGTVIHFIYNIINDYGASIIIFTILVKCLTFFMSLSQRRDSLKMNRVQKEGEEIKKKYKNDIVTQNKKIAELYQREKISPFSSCLFFIVQIVILFAMLGVVSYPLKYVKKTPQDKIEKYSQILYEENLAKENKKENSNELSSELKEKNDANKNEEKDKAQHDSKEIKENKLEKIPIATRQNELNIIRRFGDEDKDVHFNMNFLGINLTRSPQDEIKSFKEDKNHKIDFKIFILPALYMVVSIIGSQISIKDMEKLQNAKKSDDVIKNDSKEDGVFEETMMQTNRNMMYMTPFLILMVTLVSPLALALYWITSAILSIIETKIIQRIIDKEELENSRKLNEPKDAIIVEKIEEKDNNYNSINNIDGTDNKKDKEDKQIEKDKNSKKSKNKKNKNNK